ncbi:MAG: hypothetical protein KAT06_01785 [Gammaproteobacteria bacterium]|nr:hypothetical protein [Gammaproteobacteria bacterium]
MINKLYVFILSLLLTLMVSNVSACAKLAKCKDKSYSAERYSAARTLARTSLGLRELKRSPCTNKVNITDDSDADITLIQNTLSQDGKFRFSLDVMKFKNRLNSNIMGKIYESKQITGNIKKICRSLESEYKGRYKIAKKDYYKIIGHTAVFPE